MSYQDIENVLRDVEELFKVAEECPRSELALLLWQLGKASQLEEHFAFKGDAQWCGVYYELQAKHYNQLAYFGYVPLDFEEHERRERK